MFLHRKQHVFKKIPCVLDTRIGSSLEIGGTPFKVYSDHFVSLPCLGRLRAWKQETHCRQLQGHKACVQRIRTYFILINLLITQIGMVSGSWSIQVSSCLGNPPMPGPGPQPWNWVMSHSTLTMNSRWVKGLIMINPAIINHQSPIIDHQTPVINHQSAIINHPSFITNLNPQSPIINQQSSISNHQLPIINLQSSTINRQSSITSRQALSIKH